MDRAVSYCAKCIWYIDDWCRTYWLFMSFSLRLFSVLSFVADAQRARDCLALLDTICVFNWMRSHVRYTKFYFWCCCSGNTACISAAIFMSSCTDFIQFFIRCSHILYSECRTDTESIFAQLLFMCKNMHHDCVSTTNHELTLTTSWHLSLTPSYKWVNADIHPHFCRGRCVTVRKLRNLNVAVCRRSGAARGCEWRYLRDLLMDVKMFRRSAVMYCNNNNIILIIL